MPNQNENRDLPISATDPTIQEKLLSQWDLDWKRIEGGFRAPHPELRNKIGVFRAVLNDKVMYVGIGTEHSNGGLAKRIADFSRSSDSARKSQSGRNIFEHRHNLEIDILVLAPIPGARATAKLLKTAMIERSRAAWNAPKHVIGRAQRGGQAA
jgi:hypothetical protein